MGLVDPVTGREKVDNINNMVTGSNFTNITAAGSYAIKSTPGVLRKVIFNKVVALGSVTLYDGTNTSGAKIGTVPMPTILLQQQLQTDYNVILSTGLYVVVVGIMDITITWE